MKEKILLGVIPAMLLLIATSVMAGPAKKAYSLDGY